MTTASTQTQPARPYRLYALYSIMILSLLGIVLSVVLSLHFYEVRAGSASFKSLCRVGEQWNCDAIAASRYSELFFGIPLSSFATGWFLAILAVCFFYFSESSRKIASNALVVMTGYSLFMSLAYVYIMVAVLHTYCLYCFGVDAVNLLLFALAVTLRPALSHGAPKPHENQAAWKWLVGIVAGCLFVGVVASKGMDSSDFKQSDVQILVDDILNRAPLPISVNDQYPSMGSKSAPITVVEFSDFQCPHCRLGAMQLNTLLNRHPNKIRVVFRNYPLDPACNRMMKQPLHPAACEAARAAYCTNQQGKFQEYYEEIFDQQDHIAPGKPEEFAKKVGADPSRLEACLKAPETQAAVIADVEEGLRLNVQATPTFFINGKKQEGDLPIPVWDNLIEKLAP